MFNEFNRVSKNILKKAIIIPAKAIKDFTDRLNVFIEI